MDRAGSIYDWNHEGSVADNWWDGLEFQDETLRDGIQSPSVTDPSVRDKEELLMLQHRCGIHHTNIGLPGAGPRAVADVTRLARFAVDHKLDFGLNCAARTHPADVQPIIDISQMVGVELEVMTFLGSSPIRVTTEGWTIERMVNMTRTAISMATEAQLPSTFVTEDTVRSDPHTLRTIFQVALDEGAKGLALCDTVGHATPEGVAALVKWTRSLVNELGYPDTVIDWHGHNDRGLSLINAMAAAQACANRIHGTALGMGERVGNTPIDLFMVNMMLLGMDWGGDLTALPEYAREAARATETPLPFNYPVFGRDAFRTATGVHAAAVIKAMDTGDDWVVDTVYSGVPAHRFGLKQLIEVGHMAGRSNVICWLQQRGIEPQDELVSVVFDAAKAGNRVLTEREVYRVVDHWRSRA